MRGGILILFFVEDGPGGGGVALSRIKRHLFRRPDLLVRGWPCAIHTNNIN